MKITHSYARRAKNIYLFCENVAEKEHAYRDYCIGICVHCLTDYWNDIKIWGKLQSKHIPPMNIDEFKKAYYPEAQGIDFWLYQNSKNTQYNVDMVDLSTYHYFSANSINDFIEFTVNNIAETLLRWL